MKKCSYCGKENDDGVPYCRGCGTPLMPEDSGVAAARGSAPQNPQRAYADRLIRRGITWLFGGIAVTLITWLMAAQTPGGGYYIIAYGAVIVGIVQFLRGLAAARGTVTSAADTDEAQELLDAAARFEDVDRAKAVALYEGILRKFPGTRESAEAQRNLQALASHTSDKSGARSSY